MADDIVAGSNDPRPPSWGLLAIIGVIGLAIIALLASIAPSGEHEVAAGAEHAAEGEHEEAVGDHSRPTLHREGGVVTTIAPKVGKAPTVGVEEVEATFVLTSKQCPGEKEFHEELTVTKTAGQISIERHEKAETLSGAMSPDGTFYAQAPDGLTRYDGKVGSDGFTAIYRQVVENCLAQYQVDAEF